MAWLEQTSKIEFIFFGKEESLGTMKIIVSGVFKSLFLRVDHTRLKNFQMSLLDVERGGKGYLVAGMLHARSRGRVILALERDDRAFTLL